jgi:hypothetical protein
MWWRTWLILICAPVAWAGAAESPVQRWRDAVDIHPVSDQPDRHTIHSYYLSCPESPDGTRILFYASKTPEGEHGDLIVRDRLTGHETVVARNVDTEDAHRAACQQWISGGRKIAYHDVKAGHWSVHIVDLETGVDSRSAEDRQLGFGRAVDDLLPLYGPHWNPGAHRGLELLNVATGKIREVLSITAVEVRYGEWLTKEFSGHPTSIYFPIMSPDGKRVFFKMAAPGSEGVAGNFRSPLASHRQGTLVFDMVADRFIFMRAVWGHPAWHPDSRRLVEVHNRLFDTEAEPRAAETSIPGLPDLLAEHPSISPDGKLLVIDGPLGKLATVPGQWGIVVCDIRGNDYQVLYRFDNSRGATSWRKNHPHPVFSADGNRIYFNVNAGDYTELHVAEARSPRRP